MNKHTFGIVRTDFACEWTDKETFLLILNCYHIYVVYGKNYYSFRLLQPFIASTTVCTFITFGSILCFLNYLAFLHFSITYLSSNGYITLSRYHFFKTITPTRLFYELGMLRLWQTGLHQNIPSLWAKKILKAFSHLLHLLNRIISGSSRF